MDNLITFLPTGFPKGKLRYLNLVGTCTGGM
eukprot:SAG31_NODE_42616_length_270_cov_1.777778_1_plen_30_part_01